MVQQVKNGRSLWETISRIVFLILTVCIALLAFEGRSLLKRIDRLETITVRHENKLTAIEANRYTSQDAVIDVRQTADQIHQLRNWIEKNYPPKWLQNDVNELKSEIRELRRLMITNSTSRPKPT